MFYAHHISHYITKAKIMKYNVSFFVFCLAFRFASSLACQLSILNITGNEKLFWLAIASLKFFNKFSTYYDSIYIHTQPIYLLVKYSPHGISLFIFPPSPPFSFKSVKILQNRSEQIKKRSIHIPLNAMRLLFFLSSQFSQFLSEQIKVIILNE